MTIIVPSHPHLRLGAQPRVFKPHLTYSEIKGVMGASYRDALVSGPTLFDYTTGLPDDLGDLGNNAIGNCTSAAKYHRLRALVFKLTAVLLPIATIAVLAVQFYSQYSGFDPQAPLNLDGTNPTDRGYNMDMLADYIIKNGMPTPSGTDKFIAAFSVDPSNDMDLSYCAAESFGVDFGITVTTSILPPDGSPPPPVWDITANDQELSGHDVYGLARLPNGNYKVNSWGKWFEITQRFLAKFCNTALCYVSPDALKNGQTVLNMDTPTWENAIRPYVQASV